MADTKLILVCKDKALLDDVTKVLVSSGKITEEEIEAWEEKTWEVKCKAGIINSKILIVGDIKDTTSLACFIDIDYERWGILYGTNPKYALIKVDTIYIKDQARYKAFLENYDEVITPIFDPPVEEQTNKVAKTLGTVGLAVATGGASLAAQKIYDESKLLIEKTRQLSLFGTWHFANNALEEFLGE